MSINTHENELISEILFLLTTLKIMCKEKKAMMKEYNEKYFIAFYIVLNHSFIDVPAHIPNHR